MNKQTPQETFSYRLSPQQRHLWRLQEGVREAVGGAHPANPFAATVVVLIEGAIEAEALREAVEDVVTSHEIFRTVFRKVPGMRLPVQMIAPDLPPIWRHLAPIPAPDKGSRGAAVAALREELAARWDLREGPLVFAGWRPFEGGGGLLLLELPALLADATGLDLLVREIAATCAARAAGETLEAPELQYSDVAEWQLDLLENEETDYGRVYWSQKRLHRLCRPALPFAAAAPAAGEREGAMESLPIPFSDEVARALVQRAEELDAPPSAVLLAAWQSLIYRFDPQDEFLLGVAFDGRSYEGLEETLGLLARSIPLVTAIDGSTPFSAMVEKAAKGVEEIQEWQEFFDWSELAVDGEDRSEPFLPVGFEFTILPEPVDQAGARWQVIHRQATPDAFALQLRASLGESGIEGAIFFDPQMVAREDGERLAEQLAILCAGAVEDVETPVARLPILGPERRKEVLGALRGEARHPPVKCIHHLFEEQATATPEAIAVEDGITSLTFSELRQRSRHIAHHLHRRGVAPDVCVAVATERSCEMIAALLGVLQAGGAYLPLDPALPKERLALMLEDSAAPLLLTQESLRSQLPTGAEILTLEEIAAAAPAELDPQALDSGVGLDNLAYVLFTSGSTGRPKGVGVAHRQLVHYAQNVAVNLNLPPRATFAMASTFASDLGNTAIFPPLIHGGTIRVLTADEMADPAAFRRAMEGGAVDCLKIVPSHLRALLTGEQPEVSLPRQRLVIGGEAAYPDWVEKLLAWMPEGELYNHYGPTETTVGVLAGPLVPVRQGRRSGALPLGRPIGDTRIYLVDQHFEPVPPWMAGELLIGGSNVARGYLGRPALTAERFIPDPFSDSPGGRLYRTGDLVRMRPGGELDFLGRIDSQIKLRGFRVELGEVESHLRQVPGVRDAVAGVLEEEGGSRCLVAWLVEESGAQLNDEDLRAALLEKLPDVMVPAVFARLDALPLNASGKVDRKALVAPRRACSTVEYVAPRTPEEEILAEIWTALLPVERVGIHDNFFKLGGDSILCIQVIARAGQAGVHLRPNQLFEQQTIAELVLVAQVEAEIDAEQGSVTGPAPLTPIQRRLFEQERAEPHHFNQSVLVTAPPDLQPDALERAWSALLDHHDALRLRFHREDGTWQQEGSAADASIVLQRFDLSDLNGEALEAAWAEAAEALEASLDLRQGPLVRIGWGDRGWGEPGRLLLVVHHLVVDGVSWRILLEDMESAYRQLTAGTASPEDRGEVILPSKTTSFRRWAEILEEHADSDALHGEAGYWKRTLARAPKLPVDLEDGENDEGSTATVSVALDERITAALLKDVHNAYNTRINDLLLTALAQAFTPWLGTDELLLDLEGHGREDALFEGVNLSRTVGWFTAVYPLRLRLGNPSSPGESLRQVKEQLRAVPRNGIAFGILRYLRAETAERLRTLGGSQVVFNYLGQFDQASEGIFGPAEGATGAQRSPRGRRPYLFEIIALVRGGRLRIEWIYSRNRHLQETVEVLASRFRSTLEALVEHCRAPEAGGFTPSDFPLTSLTQQQLDRVAGTEREAVEDLYPLSPMQKSLYLFGLQHPRSGVGVEQMSFSLRGDLDPEAFWQGWQAVVDRHPVLRTRFVGEGVPEPLQRVERRVRLPRRQDDWRSRSPEAQEEGLKRFLAEDLKQGFDFAAAPMLRITLLREADDRWRFVFTRHHAILDGWSNVLLLQEGFLNYEALQRGGAVERRPAEPYRHYIEWLRRQDLQQAEAFWRGRLKGFTRPTELRLPGPEGGAPTGAGRETRILSAKATAALETMARRHVVTLNTVIQGAWALLLSRYSGREQALFGHTVSGRPPALGQMESMVGLFINNLPVPVRVREDSTLESWLKALQLQQVEATNFAYAPPERVQEWSEIPPARRFFDTLMVFENYPLGTADRNAEGQKPTLVMGEFEAPVKTGYQLTLVAVPGDELTLAVTYDRQRVAGDAVQRVLEDLASLLEGFPDHIDAPLATHLQRITPPAALAGEAEPTLGERAPLVAPRNPLESAVAEVFAELLGLSPVGVHDDFFELGGSSFLALSLVRRIGEKVGQEIPLSALVGGTTVEGLAEILRRQSSAAGRTLVPLQPQGEKPPLFLVHSAGGMIVNLLELARVMDRDRPLYALQDPRLAVEEDGAARSVEALAEAYLEEIRGVQGEGPYHLGGHSFGGVVAFEMARRLEEEGETVGSVLLFDSTAPAAAAELPDDAAVLSHIGAIFARFNGRDDPPTEEELRALPEERRIGRILEVLDEAAEGAEAFTRFFHLYKDHLGALRSYAPATFTGPVTLFRAEDGGGGAFHGPIADPATLGWSRYTGDGGVRVIMVAGDHTTMLRPPHVHHLAEAIAATVEPRRAAEGMGGDHDG